MMLSKIFLIYDSVAKVYSRPIFAQSKGALLRDLMDLINDQKKEHTYARHPECYVLFEAGEYDDVKGDFRIYEAREKVATFLELVK